MTGIVIVHEGYRQSFVDLKDKWVRNEPKLLLEDQERPDLAINQYNLGHHFMVRAQSAGMAGQESEAAGYMEKARHYLEKGLLLADPATLFYSRMVMDAMLSGIKVGGVDNVHLWPESPLNLGVAPDPLMRKAA